jgi:hypothetical protein
MIITKKFLMDNRTRHGAWTRCQIEALGLKWPLKQGWQTRIIGKEISSESAERFINGKSVFKGKSRNRNEIVTQMWLVDLIGKGL